MSTWHHQRAGNDGPMAWWRSFKGLKDRALVESEILKGSTRILKEKVDRIFGFWPFWQQVFGKVRNDEYSKHSPPSPKHDPRPFHPLKGFQLVVNIIMI